ncbi:MAG: NAD-dependent protein deacylase [Gemmatimonadota bacterium]|nr:NAD-dependent protein deacylase [Gemmatimonadota bacterium]
MDAGIRRAREILSEDAAVALTGSGISVESGVPTFRGEEGLWRRFRPEELATPAAFDRDPRLVWEWYAWRRGIVRECRPNAAHRALARWSLDSGGRTVVSQNVDGLHVDAHREFADEEAASGPDRPIELHGSLFRARCTACRARRRSTEPIDASSVETLPRCPECGALERPDVVWFGESLERKALDGAFDAAEGARACLVVGTSARVQPAASVAIVASRSGARLVEVNPESTPLTRIATVSLRRPAGELVPRILPQRRSG